ncbi:hypothetical protein R1flu_002900 [Riccia fluitans]|uniref:Uncharacterized protein n=1 Tax=Riccia fluitans TaxID=41844 RepID=A0ABD1Y7H3_9MARC
MVRSQAAGHPLAVKQAADESEGRADRGPTLYFTYDRSIAWADRQHTDFDAQKTNSLRCRGYRGPTTSQLGTRKEAIANTRRLAGGLESEKLPSIAITQTRRGENVLLGTQSPVLILAKASS